MISLRQLADGITRYRKLRNLPPQQIRSLIQHWGRLAEQVAGVGMNQLVQRMSSLSQILSGQSEQTR
jgi:hypothetical protein